MFKNRLSNNLIEQVATWAITTALLIVWQHAFFALLELIALKIENVQKARKSKKDK